MTASFDTTAPFSQGQAAKEGRLLAVLRDLTQHHFDHCPAYARMLSTWHPDWGRAESITALPWLPVGLFKRLQLISVPAAEIVRELNSSGTTGSAPARIYLDGPTARRQTQALLAIVKDFLGVARRPMLIIDSDTPLAKNAPLSARRAAVLGFSTFGRDHTYALRPDLQIDWPVVNAFLSRHAGQPILVFGFTFMIWHHLLTALADLGLRLPEGSILLHGGGWKKMSEQQVDPATFKGAIRQCLGVESVHDYYGMAEQVGSIFIECASGRLHVPAYAEVVIRDRYSLRPLAAGQTGLIQVLSELPLSYPGHSVLTEDVGAWLGVDDCPCGRLGRTMRVEGRLPQAELRGCSDTGGGLR